jgi:hypothetical protein
METQNASKVSSANLVQEFSGACLGDVRLERRLISIAQQISARPSESFPLIFSGEADLEAFYRFVSNPAVHWENILEPHHRQTRSRVSAGADIIAIHDSSPLQFRRKTNTDIGFISRSRKGKVKDVGFFGHFTLAVSAGTNSDPLGLVQVKPIRRSGKMAKRRRYRAGRKGKEHAKFESCKWIEGIRETRRKLGASAQIIHVMDREADFFTLMGDLDKSSERFVIRVSHDRKIQAGEGVLTVSQALAECAVICEREVYLSERPQRRGTAQRKRYPARASRNTLLTVTATSVKIKRSEYASALEYPDTLPLNVVHVTEPNPPNGAQPVDWKLFTTEPIDSEAQVLNIVDIYRKRWLIEEFFKALKTGCSYEDRQLESFKTVMNTLAIMLPIAWQMLLLRYHSRQEGPIPSTPLLRPLQLAIMISLSKGKLNQLSSSKELLCAIARLGGHIKNNGAPGWLVIYRGLRELNALERGARIDLTAVQDVINL